MARSNLDEGDVLLVRGDAQAARLLATDTHLALPLDAGAGGLAEMLFNRRRRFDDGITIENRTVTPSLISLCERPR